MRLKICLAAKSCVSIGNESRRKLAALNCQCDLFDRIKLTLAITPCQICAQLTDIASDSQVSFDVPNHSCVSHVLTTVK